MRVVLQENPGTQTRVEAGHLALRGEQEGAPFQENLLTILSVKPYPKTDTGGQVEKTKVNE